MKFFHRHTFDPEKWELVSSCEVEIVDVIHWNRIDKGRQFVYKNTCKDCGDLVFRRVQEVE